MSVKVIISVLVHSPGKWCLFARLIIKVNNYTPNWLSYTAGKPGGNFQCNLVQWPCSLRLQEGMGLSRAFSGWELTATLCYSCLQDIMGMHQQIMPHYMQVTRWGRMLSFVTLLWSWRYCQSLLFPLTSWQLDLCSGPKLLPTACTQVSNRIM